MNTVLTVPDYFVGSKKEEVNIYFYKATEETFDKKVKLNLSQNLLSLVINGKKVIISKEEVITVNQREIVLIPSTRMVVREKTLKGNKLNRILLFFSNNFLLDFVQKHRLKIQAHNRGSNDPRIMVFSMDDFIHNFQNSLELLNNEVLKGTFKENKMEEILLYLISRHPRKIYSFISSCIDSKPVHSFKQTIQCNIFNNLTYEELAFLCHMSVSSFKRKFSAIYHTTPKKYYISQRMEHADLLLRNRKRPSEIYFELGYESLSSFSTEFKKHFGVSPKNYHYSELTQ